MLYKIILIAITVTLGSVRGDLIAEFKKSLEEKGFLPKPDGSAQIATPHSLQLECISDEFEKASSTFYQNLCYSLADKKITISQNFLSGSTTELNLNLKLLEITFDLNFSEEKEGELKTDSRRKIKQVLSYLRFSVEKVQQMIKDPKSNAKPVRANHIPPAGDQRLLKSELAIYLKNAYIVHEQICAFADKNLLDVSDISAKYPPHFRMDFGFEGAKKAFHSTATVNVIFEQGRSNTIVSPQEYLVKWQAGVAPSAGVSDFGVQIVTKFSVETMSFMIGSANTPDHFVLRGLEESAEKLYDFKKVFNPNVLFRPLFGMKISVMENRKPDPEAQGPRPEFGFSYPVQARSDDNQLKIFRFLILNDNKILMTQLKRVKTDNSRSGEGLQLMFAPLKTVKWTSSKKQVGHAFVYHKLRPHEYPLSDNDLQDYVAGSGWEEAIRVYGSSKQELAEPILKELVLLFAKLDGSAHLKSPADLLNKNFRSAIEGNRKVKNSLTMFSSNVIKGKKMGRVEVGVWLEDQQNVEGGPRLCAGLQPIDSPGFFSRLLSGGKSPEEISKAGEAFVFRCYTLMAESPTDQILDATFFEDLAKEVFRQNLEKNPMDKIDEEGKSFVGGFLSQFKSPKGEDKAEKNRLI